MSDAPTAAASDADQIAAVAADLLGAGDAAEQLLPDTEPVESLIPSSPEVPAAPAAGQEADTTFSFDVEVPDELQDFLDEPEFDDTDDTSVEPAVALEEGEYEDPEVAALRKRAIAAEKKAEYEKNLRVKRERKAWEAEAAKFFPLSDPASIQADSRRGFLRAAKAQHEQMKPHAERIRAQIEAEARAKAVEAWGKPQGGGPQVPSESVEQSRQVERGFEQRGLQGGIREMLRTGKLRL